MSEWQPIETAPKDGNSILVGTWFGNEFDCAVCVWNGEWWDLRCLEEADYDLSEEADYDLSGTNIYFQFERPTHWMPLPTPPEQER